MPDDIPELEDYLVKDLHLGITLARSGSRGQSSRAGDKLSPTSSRVKYVAGIEVFLSLAGGWAR